MAQDKAERHYEHIEADRDRMLVELHGMEYVLQMEMSEEAKADIRAQIGRHKEYLALMDAVVQAVNTLETAGPVTVERSPEVQEELDDLIHARQDQMKAALADQQDQLTVVQELFGGKKSTRARKLAEEHRAEEHEVAKAEAKDAAKEAAKAPPEPEAKK